jgi:hypothetical protein
VCKAVTKMLEINEYNTSGSYVVYELSDNREPRVQHIVEAIHQSNGRTGITRTT